MATALAVAGKVLSAVGSIQQGNAANKAAGFEAAQLEQQARAERATAQREAIERKRQIDLAQSRARTLAAAGGTALESPTVANIMGGLDVEAQQAFDQSIAIGEERATGLQTSAAARRIEGRQAKQAGRFKALSSVAKFAGSTTGQSLYEKYGGDTLNG